MHLYKFLLQTFLAEYMKEYRKAHHITQEVMAEYLRISPRAYINLESGKNGCSAATLMFFLLILPEAGVLRLCSDFRELVREVDHHVVA